MGDPCFLDLNTSWRWVASFTPLLLYLWVKIPRYPLDKRLVGLQGWFGPYGEGENSWPYQDSNSDPSQPVASPYTHYATTHHIKEVTYIN
jgi:hypothetical protein